MQAVGAWIDDYAPSMGAALAYYTLFSIAPLLLIVDLDRRPRVRRGRGARRDLRRSCSGLMGDEGARGGRRRCCRASASRRRASLATRIGVVALLVGATTVFGELQNALDRIWRAPARKAAAGLWQLLRARLLSFGMILGIGFLLIVSLVASAALAALGKWWAPVFGGWAVLAAGRSTSSSASRSSTAVFAMIYKIMPRVRIEWRDVWIGAAVTALLFTIGKFLIGLYIGESGVASGFGAAGSLVVLLVWVYYSAQIFLLGAEFTRVYAHARGTRCDAAVGAERRPGGEATGGREPAAAALERSRQLPAEKLGAGGAAT